MSSACDHHYPDALLPSSAASLPVPATRPAHGFPPATTPTSRTFPSSMSAADPSPHAPAPAKFRASLGGPGALSSSSSSSLSGGAHGSASASSNWRAVSPGRASTGAVGLADRPHSLRPASELLSVSHGGGGGASQFPSATATATAGPAGDTEAIDRWFEDLQQYEATLEEMAAASLDANFKEELGAIEQWFRVLSEAERTAALYSLLQSATPLQMRFFITILQQMARQDPVSAALLSPANPSQLSFESQMEAKLASFGLKSPASPVVRQFARQSLAASGAAGSPAAAAAAAAGTELLAPPEPAGPVLHAHSPAANTLASQRAKLKAAARTSAPANLLLGASGGTASLGESLKSPLWAKEDDTIRERSPSPRPKSTGSTTHHHDGANGSGSAAELAAGGAYLRSPAALDVSQFDTQLSPLVGGNWASMVNTPLVPMFGKGETMEPGNFGAGASPNPHHHDGGWNGGSPNPGGIVLDDARKFRRSARISGGAVTGLTGGALGGMYDDAASSAAGSSSVGAANDRAQSAATAQKRVQDQLHAVQQLKNMQQSALHLGLGALGSSAGAPSTVPLSPGVGGGSVVTGSRLTSAGGLSSPGLQQTAMAAQQNWRNANAAHLPPPSPQQQQQLQQQHQNHQMVQQQQHQQQHQLDPYGLIGGGGAGLAGLGVGVMGHGGGGPLGSPSPQQIQAQTQAQLASLVALQQQMIQQQQQLQSLASLNGLGIPNAGLGVGMGGVLLGTQLSPRLGGSGGGGGPGGSPGVGGGFGLGFGGGMPSPRRSPRPHGLDRSPHFGSYAHSSRPGGGANGGGGTGGAGAAGAGSNSSAHPQQTPGSGANPDEPLDMALLADTPAWLRSLRLHKYTGIFERATWQEMAVMSDRDLEEKGVGALGARRKLLKVFETVRAKTGLALPAGADRPGSSTSPSPSLSPSSSPSSPVPEGSDPVASPPPGASASPPSPSSESAPVTPNLGALPHESASEDSIKEAQA